ncbi:MAG: ABC transporter permease [Rhodospirillaceae bacterium]|nr:ABC transporter permease [Rhodospirillaceae bacterium]
MMLHGLGAVYLREMRILKRRFKRHIVGMAISPLLYLVAFGTAMGTEARFDGHTYLEFLLPGLVAMTSMTQSFSTSTEINIARFYLHIFEEFQSAPISNVAYVLGEVLSGMTRALIGIVLILGLGAAFGVILHTGPWFWLAAALNAFAFSSLAVLLAMIVRSHGDQALLNAFVITPMAFLGGTFFPLDRLPEWAQNILYALPLTHAAQAIRGDVFGRPVVWAHFAVLVAVGAVVFIIALKSVGRARD